MEFTNTGNREDIDKVAEWQNKKEEIRDFSYFMQ